MKTEPFEQMLTGGHPNSLGRTLEVVDIVLANRKKLPELYGCYFSSDEVVRLRTSNALKRVSLINPEWLVPYIDRLLTEIAAIDQASTQWTLALLYNTLAPFMSPAQRKSAIKVMKRNLEQNNDWIVLNNTMQILTEWAQDDAALKKWLRSRLGRLKGDERKSVSARARKFSILLYGE